MVEPRDKCATDAYHTIIIPVHISVITAIIAVVISIHSTTAAITTTIVSISVIPTVEITTDGGIILFEIQIQFIKIR